MNLFRISSNLANLQFSTLPASKEHAAVLRRLKLRFLGDLIRISWLDLRAVSKHTYSLTKELDDLVQLSQAGIAEAPEERGSLAPQ